MSKLPRGIRNNNPGNIEYTGTPWQGLADPPSDGRFCVFTAPRWGIRAIARVLITYQDKHDLNTVRGLIDRWAPPVENDTGAYVRHVAARLVVGPDAPVNVHDYATMRPLVEAIIRHENGMQPYDSATIDQGLKLAGVEPPMKPLAKSRTLAGATMTTVGAAGSAAADLAPQLTEAAGQVEALAEYGWVFKAMFAALLIGGVSLTVYARLSDRIAGKS